MTIEAMREIISRCYKSDSWKNRCRKMNDGQVVAIYYKFLETGKFSVDKNARKSPREEIVESIPEKEPVQLSLFEMHKSSDAYIRT